MKFKVEWKEGYPKTKPKIVSFDELKQDHWNLDAYGEDIIGDLFNLNVNDTLDVVGIFERATFTKLDY
tara:strand:- start:107 stop:310 length:204 start_codon:yes stop_codon:yes gene_type:complete